MDGVFNNFLNQTWNEKYNNNNNNSSTSNNIAASNGKTNDNNGNNNEKSNSLSNNGQTNNGNGSGNGQLSLSDIMERNMMRQQFQQLQQNLSFFSNNNNNNNNTPSTSNATTTPLSASIDFRDLRPTTVPTNSNSFKSPSETPAQHLARLTATKPNNPFTNHQNTNTNHEHYRNSFTNNSIPFAAMCNAMVANAGSNAQNSGGHIASQADSTSPPPSQSAAVSLLALQAGASGNTLNGNGLGIGGATQLGSLIGVGTGNGGDMDKKTPNSIRGKTFAKTNEFLIINSFIYQ